ncbi:related to Che-1 [Lecanosticta acicola]|uniref:Protein BFR2 n=1 Tax=Lecanosticta acicola TaxID=111012 RepID=A0AAI8YXD8_9PEZI|nr:related to Che-1 [Lecanosticta acicola]
MAPNRGRNRQREFAQTTVQDFDPEEEHVAPASEDESDGDEEGEDFDGREHYADVGKSKLRTAKAVPLGPQYGGSKVGREELEDEEDDDPFSRGFDEEGSSEDGGFEEYSDEDGIDESEAGEEEMLDGTDDTDLSEEEEEVVTHRPKVLKKEEEEAALAAVKQIQDQSLQRAASKSLLQANQEEAEKGRAIKGQRATFDALLNTRMKLQKSLIATNTLVGTAPDQIASERSDAYQALEAAETAAFTLWESLNSFRDDLLAARTGEKRKRSAFSIDTSTEELWNHFQLQEKQSRKDRNSVLKKWSIKTQGPSAQTQKGRLNQSTEPATIIEVLEQQLSNDRVLKRAHAPRSCAPLQAEQRVTEDPKIYDDADFYGLLLKELLEQKAQDSVTASNIDLGFQMRREAKTKRNVDTKASKGRKLRYTAHEKLENFMAPEDRTRWGERQADELFGSLFGQRLRLGEREDEDEEGDDEMEGGVDAEEAGLLMFRS